MAFVPWKDRVTATPHRYQLTEVAPDTYDLKAVPGAVSEAGTPVTAANMNRLIQRDGDDIKDTVTTFTEASTRANIATGESTATLFGKIKKYFTDLKTHAFTTPSTAQGTGTTTVPSDKLLRESSFARVYRSFADLGLPNSSTIAELHSEMINNSRAIIAVSTFNHAIYGNTGLELPNNLFYVLEAIRRDNERLTLKLVGKASNSAILYQYEGMYYTYGTTNKFTGWKLVINDSDNQTISGVKTFSASPIVPISPSGVSAAVSKSYVDGALANPTILGNGDFFRNDNGIEVYSSAVESCINHFGLGFTGTTGSYNATTRTLKSDTFETAGKYAFLYQYIDNPARLNGKTVTLSAKAASTTGFFRLQFWKRSDGTTTSIGETATNKTLSKSVTVTMASEEFAAGDTLRVIFQTYGETVLDYIKLEIGGLAPSYTPEQALISTVYDKVIHTQAEFNELINSANWLGAKSVALVGQFTLSTENNGGIQIPATVKQIHGFNSAKITITNFKYNSTTGKGGLWYNKAPTTEDYSIRDLEVSCTAPSGFGYGFYACRNLSNCIGTGTGTYGYGFYSIEYAVNCKHGGSSTNMWGGENKNIDLDTCRKTLVIADKTELNA